LENGHCSSFIENEIRLRNFNDHCFVVYYSNVSKCVKFLKRARSRDYVIVIITSYTVEALQRMLYRLQQYRVAQTVLVVSSDDASTDHLLSTSDRISVFRDQKTMFDHLERLIDKVKDQNLEGGLFTTFHRREKALKDLRLEFGEFIWAHVFRGQYI
jgi:vacuolar-type H+-ATPase subunit F/Vma7